MLISFCKGGCNMLPKIIKITVKTIYVLLIIVGILAIIGAYTIGIPIFIILISLSFLIMIFIFSYFASGKLGFSVTLVLIIIGIVFNKFGMEIIEWYIG